MAMVQVDLSEYDMLREAKKKAEKEVEELKETVKGLEDKSRVILTTEYVYPTINKNGLYNDIYNLIEKSKMYDKLNPELRFSMRGHYDIPREIDSVLHYNIKVEGRSYDLDMSKRASSQYIGFEDIKAKVEEHYKKDLDKAIADYKEAEEDYHKLRDSVEEFVREGYENEINRLKEEQKKVLEYNKKRLSKLEEEKNTEINKLKDKITELSKSKEEKISELMATIKEAQAKLEELSETKKKGLFNKIFG